ncbi:hypothetical protein MMC14_002306 [Varicellaria rhodocarpa]|nr:hypothetical protein [Varicellaria rhodocarpa]
MEEKDVSNFTSSSSHRLPTVSASEAFSKLASSHRLPISTGLACLDELLQCKDSASEGQQAPPGGLRRGQVTEVYGPPGVGKTSLAIQAAASSLHAAKCVVWIDTAHTIPGSRLAEVVSSYRLPHDQDVPSSPPITRTLSDLLEDFHHFITPTLPHLIALLNSPSVSFPPQATNIIVIDSISAVLVNAFPTAVDAYDPRQAQGKRSETIQWAASRRWSVYGDLISRLGKLAAVQNLAIILISQTTTKVRADTGAVLYPSISIKAWDGGVHNRIVLFRDWLPNIETSVTQDLHHQGVRIAALIKAGSTSCDALGKIVSFTVEKHGLQEHAGYLGVCQVGPLSVLPSSQLKRKRDEIADSASEEEDIGSDEEFGWADDDDPLVNESLADDNDPNPETTASITRL